MRTRRLKLMFACLSGCVIGALAGLILSLRCGNPVPALITATILPVLACYIAGLRDGPLLAKIGFYAGVGWGLTFVLEPTVAERIDFGKIATAPLVGYEWCIPCSVVSSLLAIVGVAFAPRDTKPVGKANSTCVE